LATGCATWEPPRIDPTGEHFLIFPNAAPAVPTPPLPGSPAATVAPPFVPGAPAAPLVVAAPAPPVGSLQAPPVYPDAGVLPPPPPSVVPAAAVAPPSVVPTSVIGAPLAVVPVPQDRVVVSPERVMAPIGTEVVLRAAILSARGYLLADERIEWMLAKEGAGQFVDLNNRGELDLFTPPWDTPRKIDNWYAIGSTANFSTTLRRNLANPTDDIPIQRGEAWISVTSPTEGASYITAYAPNIADWQQRRAIATIYWVDAQWLFAPSAVEEPGRPHVLTTTVTRRSDGTPVQGWIVRYDVAGGSLGYSAGKSIEVPTDASGRASVEVSPTDVGGGSATVTMVLVRPPQTLPVATPQLEVGRGAATISWGAAGVSSAPIAAPAPIVTSPPSTYASPGPKVSRPPPPTQSVPLQPAPLQPGPAQPIGSAPTDPYAAPPSTQPAPALKADLSVQVTRTTPEQVKVGDFASFDVVVINRGTATAHKIEVLDNFDHGLKHPNAQPDEFAIKYPGMKDLAPGESAKVALTFEVTAPGQQCHSVTVSADTGNPATERGCVTASAAKAPIAPTIEVYKVAPTRQYVGETAKFKVVIKNSGQVPITHLEVLDQYDTAFNAQRADAGSQTVSPGRILWRIDRLDVGERREFKLEAACVTATSNTNRTCSRVTVTADDGINAMQEKCVEILPLSSP
jgi:uncharacterized repeat protein (TIGR01451 family)